MDSNDNGVASRICALAAAQNLLMAESRERPDNQRYLARLLYLVRTPFIELQCALASLPLPTAIAEADDWMNLWATDKFNLQTKEISDLWNDKTDSGDTLAKYFARVLSSYLLALTDAEDFITGNKPVGEADKLIPALLRLVASAEIVLAEYEPKRSYAIISNSFLTVFQKENVKPMLYYSFLALLMGELIVRGMVFLR